MCWWKKLLVIAGVLTGAGSLPDPGGLGGYAFAGVMLVAFVAVAVASYVALDVVMPRGCSEMGASFRLGLLFAGCVVVGLLLMWPASEPLMLGVMCPTAGGLAGGVHFAHHDMG